MLTGACSVTFRKLAAHEVLDLAARAGVDAIEWGGDVHVPAGDVERARSIGRRTCEAGLVPASYGSYLEVGRPPDAAYEFRVLDTAVALGARNVRVWARGGERDAVASGLQRVARGAEDRGLTVSVEFHPGTCTETAASTMDLLSAVDAANVHTYWQPDPELDDEANLAELATVAPRLSHLHVFRWTADRSRLPLRDGADLWVPALRAVEAVERVAFLEFVANDDPIQFVADARTLREWLR